MDQDTSENETYAGDFVAVERTTTPTEAHILMNCLQAAGVAAHVADANFVQSNWIWSNAAGGVRVLVPAAQVDRAREVIAEFRSGRLELDGESTPAPATVPLPPGQALWNPDVAALWGLWLTPLFGALLVFVNARTLGGRKHVAVSFAWLAVCAIATAFAMGTMLARERSFESLAVATGLLAPLAALWYGYAAREQSRLIVERHGRRYARRSIIGPLIPALVLYVAPVVMSEFIG